MASLSPPAPARIRASAAIVLLLLTGCSVKAPTARVVAVDTDRVTEQGARVLVTVELTNPNDVALPLPKTRYRVAVEGAEPFAFETPPALALPPLETQLLTLPAAFATPDAAAMAGRPYEVTGAVTYQPPGQLRLLLSEYHIPLPTSRFSGSGTLVGTEPRP